MSSEHACKASAPHRKLAHGPSTSPARSHRPNNQATRTLRRAGEPLAPATLTLGNHIAFGPGHWSPERTSGRRLLAHELAHVVRGGWTLRHRPKHGWPRFAFGAPNRAVAEVVAIEKWSPEIERPYRWRRDWFRADAIGSCRELGGGPCEILLTARAVSAMYGGSEAGTAGGAAADAPVAARMMINPVAPMPSPGDFGEPLCNQTGTAEHGDVARNAPSSAET